VLIFAYCNILTNWSQMAQHFTICGKNGYVSKKLDAFETLVDIDNGMVELTNDVVCR